MNPFQRRLLWTSSLLTAATGLVYWWMETRLQPTDPWAAINHPLQPWVLKAHILVAPLLVFAVGLIAGEHIWRQYRANVGTGRRSGVMAMVVLVPLVLSGYLIQAVTHVRWLEALGWVHLATGVVYLGGIVLHARFVRDFVARRVQAGIRAPGGDGWEAVGGARRYLSRKVPGAVARVARVGRVGRVRARG